MDYVVTGLTHRKGNPVSHSYGEPPPVQPQYQYPPKPKRKKWPWVLLVIGLLMVGGFVACTAAVGGAMNAAVAEKKFTYELSGEGSVQAGWAENSGSIVSSQVDLPWRKEVTFAQGTFATATLNATVTDGKTVTCKITDQDGKVVAEASTPGGSQAAIVTCTPSPMGAAPGH